MTYQDVVFVGIDVGKQHLDVGLHPLGELSRFTNDKAGLAALARLLRGYHVALVVMEATGRLHDLAARSLRDAGFSVAVVNPGRVRHFARAKGQLAKTDRIDALALAEYGALMQPAPGLDRDAAGQALTDLVLRRRQLVAAHATERNRLHSLPDHNRSAALKRSFETVMSTLAREIAAIERRIDGLITSHEAFKQRDEMLRSTLGIGPVASHTLIAELPELGSLTRRETASLVGVAPVSRDSGAFRGRRSIQGGRRQVRNVLYMATLTAIRCNPSIRDFHNRLRNRGKPPKVAITACMRKLIVILNAMIRDQKSWQQA